MPKPTRPLVLALGIGVIACLSSPCRAGRDVWPIGCDTVSVSPLRIRLHFYMVNLLNSPLCQVRFAPTSYLGSTFTPILDCTAPSTLTCALQADSGSATFTSNPCAGGSWAFYDSLSVTVGAVSPCFLVTIYSFSGPIQTRPLCFNCASLTPTLPETWGHLKSTYR